MNDKKCGVKGCRRKQKLCLRVQTTDGPEFLMFCNEHVGVLRSVVEDLEAEMNKQEPRNDAT